MLALYFNVSRLSISLVKFKIYYHLDINFINNKKLIISKSLIKS